MTIKINFYYFGIVCEVEMMWLQSVWPGLVIRDVKLRFDDHGGQPTDMMRNFPMYERASDTSAPLQTTKCSLPPSEHDVFERFQKACIPNPDPYQHQISSEH